MTNFTIAIVALPNFNLLATTAFIDPFRAANYLQRESLYQWHMLALEEGFVQASNGLELSIQSTIADAAIAYDLVMVSASWLPEQYQANKALHHFVQQHYRRGAVLGSVDTGSEVLAAAGLLNGKQATIHYEHMASMRELYPQVQVVEGLYTTDGRMATCCGGQAAGDMALSIIRDRQGVDVANSAARYIFHDRLRSPTDEQLPSHYEPVGHSIPGKLRAAIVMMEAHLEQILTIPQVSDSVGLSQRQLTRLFKNYTGITPVQYYIEVRLDRAHSMITQTQLSILDVAVACGFNSQEHFSKAYVKRFGCAPTVDRDNGRVPFHYRSFPAPHKHYY